MIPAELQWSAPQQPSHLVDTAPQVQTASTAGNKMMPQQTSLSENNKSLQNNHLPLSCRQCITLCSLTHLTQRL